MSLDEALAVLEYYKLAPPTDERNKRVALTAATLVGEAAKQVIQRYLTEERSR